jgi:hypothetical protein
MTNMVLDIVLILATGYIVYVTVKGLKTGVAAFRYGTVRRDEHPIRYWFNIIAPMIILVMTWIYIIILRSKK